MRPVPNRCRHACVAPEALADLIGALAGRGYRVLGPTVRDGAIVYEDLESADDLPIGWKDVQDAASYRLERRDDEARFGYAVGPHSWKQFLFPPKIRLWQAQRGADGFEIEEEPLEDAPLALIGVRSCELHAIAIQDKVFHRRQLHRPRLRRAPQGRVHRRGQLLRAVRHVLLRLDGHRPEGRTPATTSR